MDDRQWEMTIETGVFSSMLICGIDDCDETLWRTLAPARGLWCPVHHVVGDDHTQPPLDLSGLILCTRI